MANLILPNGVTIQTDDPSIIAAYQSQGAENQSDVLAQNPGQDIRQIADSRGMAWNSPGGQGYSDAMAQGHNDPTSDPSNPLPFSTAALNAGGVDPTAYQQSYTAQHGQMPAQTSSSMPVLGIGNGSSFWSEPASPYNPSNPYGSQTGGQSGSGGQQSPDGNGQQSSPSWSWNPTSFGGGLLGSNWGGMSSLQGLLGSPTANNYVPQAVSLGGQQQAAQQPQGYQMMRAANDPRMLWTL